MVDESGGSPSVVGSEATMPTRYVQSQKLEHEDGASRLILILPEVVNVSGGSITVTEEMSASAGGSSSSPSSRGTFVLM